MQDQQPIKEKDWLHYAKTFGRAFVETYCPEDVTPYLHVLVYHLGFYLEAYGNLEVFANYGIEGRHRYNKQLIKTATNGFGRMGNVRNVVYQELTHSMREDSQYGHTKKRQKRAKNWATKSLEKFPDIDAIFSL